MEISGSLADRSATSQTQGFNGLTADDFFKLLIAQLQNQDPTSPVGNDQLLQQLSTMRGLQSNIELSETLERVADSLKTTSGDNGEKLSVGASYIGTSVTLDDTSTGFVDRAFVLNEQTYVGVNGVDVPISRVVSVNSPQSFVNQLIAFRADAADATATDETVLGFVTGTIKTPEGIDLVIQPPGREEDPLPDAVQVDSNLVTNVYSAAALHGMRVSVLSSDGVELSDDAVLTSTVAGEPALTVGSRKFTLDRVIGIGSSS